MGYVGRVDMINHNINVNSHHNGSWEFHIEDVNERSSGDIFRREYSSEMVGRLEDSVDLICANLNKAGLQIEIKFSCSYYVLKIKRGSALAAVMVHGDPAERSLSFDVVGERNLSDNILEIIKNNFEKVSHGTLKWYRLDQGNLDYNRIVIKSKRKVYDEFYPWIKEGIESYLDRFMKSSSSILLMLGPPGTGKTSMIRYLISSRNLTAMFSYDEDLLESDKYFSRFIVGDSNLMVMEDADILIGSRENGNKFIPRFLNTAEGLVKIDGKKMIFTTNLESIRNIDSALVRPGRCFDVMKTRLLTHKEMLAVVAAAGLENTPPWKEEYSLSEIFCPTDKPQKVERRIGF
jgi:hypothetical protein